MKTKVTAKYRLVVANRKDRYLEILKDAPYADEHKKQVIDHVMRQFEREDRITWWLRRARASDLAEIFIEGPEHFEKYRSQLKDEGLERLLQGKEQAKKRLEKLVNAPADSAKWKERIKSLYDEGKELEKVLTELSTVLNKSKEQGFKSVLDYRFPAEASSLQVIEELRRRFEIEKNNRPPARYIHINDMDKPLIKFPDGWAWVLLDRESCNQEAGAMQHCGNSASRNSDKILSLREMKEWGKDRAKKKFWYPHLTFIVNNGALGEMKGYTNSKPKKELHKYIIPLLEHNMIEAVRGGGYKPNANFSLKDLTSAELKALLRKKPNIDAENTDAPDDDDDDYDGDEDEDT